MTMQPLPADIEAYICPQCKAILYVKTPDDTIVTFTRKQLMKHINTRVSPPLPQGLVFTYRKTRDDHSYRAYYIILDEGTLTEGTGNTERYLYDHICFSREREWTHSFRHEVGVYDTNANRFYDSAEVQKYSSRTIRGQLGRKARLLTIGEFARVEDEFRKLNADRIAYSSFGGRFRDFRCFDDLRELVRTTPELEELIRRNKRKRNIIHLSPLFKALH